MRLIDADALKESVSKNPQGQLYRFEVYGLICDAPTIDAIPMEWLEDHSQVSPIRGIAVKGLIEEWHKEQAADHPEPKYPTWAEWLESVHVLTNNKSVTYKDGNVTYGTKYYQSVSPNTEFYQPIPADIAEKLGIQPKEADHGNV